MTQLTLTLLDTTGIQDYIFASNRLQENIGASELVYRSTSLWAFEALEAAGIEREQHNIENPKSYEWQFRKVAIEKDDNLQVEVIQAAGGNTLILFRNSDNAKKFVEVLTLRLLNEAPGLTVLARHKTINFETQKLQDVRKTLEEDMRLHKQTHIGSVPILGLGVTATCASTGLPAVNTLKGKWLVEDKPEPLGLPGEIETTLVSRQVAAKRGWRKKANERLKVMLKDSADDFIFPYDLEKIGRIKGEESYIAVIHADGNRMGARVRQIAEDSPDNRSYIKNMREFSSKINVISHTALQIVVGLVTQAVKLGDIPFVEDKDEKYLPFRPLVFGGDDVTFVCSGLIGVSLAATYLQAFENQAREQGLSDFHASAGISIVKMHYPFARAYKLSEELTANAKTLNRIPKMDCSALDWHFAQSGLSGSLEMIRKREYTTVDGGKLNLRPLQLHNHPESPSWIQLQNVMAEFDQKWGEKHNKVIGLREALRKDKQGLATQKYRQDFDLNLLPAIPGADVQETGWKDGVCYYFDAIELLDHHVSLEPQKQETIQ